MIHPCRIITKTIVENRSADFCKEFMYKCYGNKYFCCVASQLFDEIPENRCATKPAKHDNAHESLESFCLMNLSGVKPTKFVLCSALNSCAITLNWYLGWQIHAHIVHVGYEDNLFISSGLVNVYAKCGELVNAKRVFDSMKRHDQVSWTSIISGFSQNRHGGEAILLFKEMLRTQIKPNFFTCVSVISACTVTEAAFECGSLLHAHVIKHGCEDNSFVVSSLIDYYSKCGRIDQAMLLFDATNRRDNILLNSMISGYSQNLCGKEALTLFMEMRNDNICPTGHTLTSILNACASLTVIQQGRQVHALIIKMGYVCNVFVVSSLIDMYSKCGSTDDARRVFDEMPEKNSILWTSMITGYAQSGKGLDGLELFDYLVKEGVVPDHVCFTAVLTACNHAGFLDRGVEYFNKMRKDYDLAPELDQYACLVDLYARNGHLRRAKKLMEEMPFEPNTVMWTSFLSFCKVYGDVELGREAAHKLFKMEPYSAVPYIMLANIYAGAGLFSEVAEIRKLMHQKGIRKNSGCSWIEVDKRVHVFSAGDVSHFESQEIYVELEKLNLEIREAVCMHKLITEIEYIDVIV